MTRVRTDDVFGTLTDNPLTNIATTMNSAGLANLAAVSSAEAIITLDPNRVAGAPEIVVVTAHTGAATSATIQRGQFGTAARQHAAGTAWVHGPIASNASTFVTAADDQGDFPSSNAWEPYTPINTNITTGNGTLTGRFMRIGRTIHAEITFIFGSSSSFAGGIGVGLPVAAAATSRAVGAAHYVDVGTRNWVGVGRVNDSGASTMTLYHTESNNTGNVGSTSSPFTWATGDLLFASVTYEAAS